jgi:FAD/FMN-containing dehydrogenase
MWWNSPSSMLTACAIRSRSDTLVRADGSLVAARRRPARKVEQLLAGGSAQGLVEDATIASSLDQAKAFWHMRHVLPEVQKPEGGSIKADCPVPVASVPQFLEEASAAAKAIIPGCRPVPFGHLGDGNVHFNVSQPIGADTAQFLARWAR